MRRVTVWHGSLASRLWCRNERWSVFQPVLDSAFACSYKDKDGEFWQNHEGSMLSIRNEKARVEKNSHDWRGELSEERYSIRRTKKDGKQKERNMIRWRVKKRAYLKAKMNISGKWWKCQEKYFKNEKTRKGKEKYLKLEI